ncbi:5,10-methylenetetrahydrofolate reductase [Microbacterium halimionae]|uniref:Methylenetetrahydrofolate reductase n=1 Tax=Microbacterium halimionae TaxID=1526413 RepID=A0A7W3JR65_9MICO|nr:methylenetetrahydrofolate reductase C-terminal domain-containing protein [Microbacterium halimionae]MBA8817492.1 5,10-methylenetetrahydrofolate reductase [Microbacterium halimionae]NII95065.1 5,10-methylenetetrahydrofolate reductase [Microbacterium halimionae]
MTLTACPKSMTFGPCGGVNEDSSCEVDPAPCVFLSRHLPVSWSEPATAATPNAATAAAKEVGRIMRRRPLVVTGFPVRAMTSCDVPRVADVLRGRADVVLSGDAGTSRTQFPPSYRAFLMAQAGVRVWMGVNARDRNRAALDREMLSLQEIGIAGIHCVTGDHTFTGDRPDARAVFDLESTTMLSRARSLGLLTSFAESPAAPPIEKRGARVREKQRAGGQMCWPQYCGDVSDVEAFIATCGDAGADVPVLPGVPLVVDREGAILLASFHAAKLPTGFISRLLNAKDVRAEGVRAAVEYGESLLTAAGVGGVVIAGGTRHGDELAYAADLATVAEALGGGS